LLSYQSAFDTIPQKSLFTKSQLFNNRCKRFSRNCNPSKTAARDFHGIATLQSAENLFSPNLNCLKIAARDFRRIVTLQKRLQEIFMGLKRFQELRKIFSPDCNRFNGFARDWRRSASRWGRPIFIAGE
jgi:hypothetical protein